jgi:toxin ParE1/3/4
LVDRLADAGNSLMDFPNRGRTTTNGRRELVTVPPYLLRYVVVDRTVFIVDIKHSARRPH